MEGKSGRQVATINGYEKLADRIKLLEEDVQQAKAAVKSSRCTVDSLLDDARVSCTVDSSLDDARVSCTVDSLLDDARVGCTVDSLLDDARVGCTVDSLLDDARVGCTLHSSRLRRKLCLSTYSLIDVSVMSSTDWLRTRDRKARCLIEFF